MNILKFQWVFLFLAVSAWGGVAWFGMSLVQYEQSRSTQIVVVQETESKGAAAARLRSLMQDTAEDRAQLEALLHSDVISIVAFLERAGGGRVTVSVSDARPEGSAVPRTISKSTGITATGFTIEAGGSFSDLMRVVERLENLPLPSTIVRVELSENKNDQKKTTWSLSAHIRILSIPST